VSQTYDALNDKLIGFIRRQKLFFVATAPLSGEGHVNVSPKGYDSLVILDAHTLAYLDLGGSGIETHAHVTENGRITLMWCAFEGPADIVRVYGRGEAVALDDPRFPELLAHFPGHDRARAVILVHVTRAADSCGWGVPFFEFKGERDQLKRWVDAKPLDEWAEHRYRTNAQSIDGLPGLVRPSLPAE
jgi:hypothetical protein